MKPKIYIIVGHYGSGKSEFALGFIQKLKAKKSVCLADLDIVNPYFRTREMRERLTSMGIEVLSDTLNSTKGLDMPYLSPAIAGIIAKGDKTMVLDCGGDEVGIRILRQYYRILVDTNYELLMIINTYRPLTSTVNQIIEMKEKLELESGLKITGYINNTNLLHSTTVSDIVKGNLIISEVSAHTGVPIKYVSGLKRLMKSLPPEIVGKKVVLDLSLRNKWL